jgi:flagella basal body P-ring formation protein FlgA
MKALVLLAALAIASPALAATPVTLRADPVDTDGIVTLGDLFDGAGSAASVPVAGRTGASVMLNAGSVRAAAARAGLDWANAESFRQIVVRGGTASGPAGAPRVGNVDALTWSRSISAGEIVQPEDLVWGKVAAAPSQSPKDPDAVIGLAARRPLRAGAAVTERDVSAPQVIKAKDIVTVTYDNQGVSLSLQGKALSSGASGDTISVQNVTSKKTILAVVTGPGRAAVGPAAEQLKLARGSRYALR